MIKRCRVCGVLAGGLVSKDVPAEVWPQTDLCPLCPDVPGPEAEELQRFVDGFALPEATPHRHAQEHRPPAEWFSEDIDLFA